MKLHIFDWLDSKERKREQNEDALKVIHAIEKKHIPFSLSCFASNCNLSVRKADKIVKRLISLGYFSDNEKKLTAEGRVYALKIIRRHRLYEKYLSEHSGFKPTEWHEEACRKEHHISDYEQDKLSAKLGHPLFDPHGDPIPDDKGAVAEVHAHTIDSFEAGDVVRVVQVEDQPIELFNTLQEIGLLPGSAFKIEEMQGNEVRIIFEGELHVISLDVANNLKLQLCTDCTEIEELGQLHKLTTLKQGEEAVIAGISSACKGVARRRLLDLGFVKGSRISIDLTSPMGNPIAYVVRGTAIALRKDQSRYILIRR